MFVMLAFFVSVFLVISPGLSFPEKDIPNVEPKYLDMLLKTKQYELLSKVLKIDDVNLVRPKEGTRSTHPMFNEGLKYGDVIMPKEHSEEEARQSLRFEVFGFNKWPGRKVPYVISDSFNEDQKRVIQNAINRWNQQVHCLKFQPRQEEPDYVWFFDGSGCWSYLGRISGGQPLSLQANGCVYQNIVLHEMDHAAGMAHEQNRPDRDDYIKIRWHNIPENWHSQYEKGHEDHYKLVGPYDFYSIMHYGMGAPETGKQAIEFKSRGVQTWRVGNSPDLTEIDVDKLNAQYC